MIRPVNAGRQVKYGSSVFGSSKIQVAYSLGSDEKWVSVFRFYEFRIDSTGLERLLCDLFFLLSKSKNLHIYYSKLLVFQ